MKNDHYVGSNALKDSRDSSKFEEDQYLTEVYDFLKQNPNPKVKLKINGSKQQVRYSGRSSKQEQDASRVSRQEEPDNKKTTKASQFKEINDKNSKNSPTEKNKDYASHENFVNLLEKQKKQITLRSVNSDDIESHRSEDNLKQQQSSPEINIDNKNNNDLHSKVEEVKKRYNNMINENSMNSNLSEKKEEKIPTESDNMDPNLKESVEVLDDENNENVEENKDEKINQENTNRNIAENQEEIREKEESNVNEGKEEAEEQEQEQEEITEEEFLIFNEAARIIQNFIKVNYMLRYYDENGEPINRESEGFNEQELANEAARYIQNFIRENYMKRHMNDMENEEEEVIEEDIQIEDENPVTYGTHATGPEEEHETGNFIPTSGTNRTSRSNPQNLEEVHESQGNQGEGTERNFDNEDNDENVAVPFQKNDNNKSNSAISNNKSDNQNSFSNNHPNPGLNLNYGGKKDKEDKVETHSSAELENKTKSQIAKSKISSNVSSNEKSNREYFAKPPSNVDSQRSNKSGLKEKIPNSNSNREFIEKSEKSNFEGEGKSHRASHSQQMSVSSALSVKSRIVYSVVRASSSRNSSILISPNSMDSPRLHRIHELIQQ